MLILRRLCHVALRCRSLITIEHCLILLTGGFVLLVIFCCISMKFDVEYVVCVSGSFENAAEVAFQCKIGRRKA